MVTHILALVTLTSDHMITHWTQWLAMHSAETGFHFTAAFKIRLNSMICDPLCWDWLSAAFKIKLNWIFSAITWYDDAPSTWNDMIFLPDRVLSGLHLTLFPHEITWNNDAQSTQNVTTSLRQEWILCVLQLILAMSSRVYKFKLRDGYALNTTTQSHGKKSR